MDWDVYVIAAEEQQCQIGNWAHTWHPGTETGAFQKANGRPFEERQHILRICGKGAFKVLILPHRKDDAQAEQKVEKDGDAFKIVAGAETLVIGQDSYTYRGNTVRFERAGGQ